MSTCGECPGWLEIGLREAQRTPRGTADSGMRSGRTLGFRPALRDVAAVSDEHIGVLSVCGTLLSHKRDFWGGGRNPAPPNIILKG